MTRPKAPSLGPKAFLLHAAFRLAVPFPLPRTFLFILAVLVPSFLGCERAPAPKSEQVTSWQPVGTWEGHGNVQTESFTSETGSFRFTWEARSEGSPPCMLRIMLHSAVSGRPLVLAVEHVGDGKDSIYVSEDPREFYVVIEAERVAWTLKVEEGISLILTPTKR